VLRDRTLIEPFLPTGVGRRSSIAVVDRAGSLVFDADLDRAGRVKSDGSPVANVWCAAQVQWQIALLRATDSEPNILSESLGGSVDGVNVGALLNGWHRDWSPGAFDMKKCPPSDRGAQAFQSARRLRSPRDNHSEFVTPYFARARLRALRWQSETDDTALLRSFGAIVDEVFTDADRVGNGLRRHPLLPYRFSTMGRERAMWYDARSEVIDDPDLALFGAFATAKGLAKLASLRLEVVRETSPKVVTEVMPPGRVHHLGSVASFRKAGYPSAPRGWVGMHGWCGAHFWMSEPKSGVHVGFVSDGLVLDWEQRAQNLRDAAMLVGRLRGG